MPQAQDERVSGTSILHRSIRVARPEGGSQEPQSGVVAPGTEIVIDIVNDSNCLILTADVGADRPERFLEDLSARMRGHRIPHKYHPPQQDPHQPAQIVFWLREPPPA